MNLGFFAGLAAAIRNVFSPSVLRVLIQDGKVSVSRGEVSRSFLSDLVDVVRDLDIRSGEIRGIAGTAGMRLEFRGMPEVAHQRIRNVWHFHAPRANAPRAKRVAR